jgi:uncharacterized protein (DUF58 family)
VIPEAYLARIRQVDVKTRHLADDLFAGEYHSVFKGRGMDFEEVREYAEGDDARQIHWNVTARTGIPHVKKFREERELSMHLLIDVSASGEMASGAQSKRELAAEIGACLAYSAIRNRDRVGLMLFSSQVEHRVPPSKGRHHLLRLIRDILYTEPLHDQTSLRTALEFFYQVQVRRSVLFVLSDFLDEGYWKALRIVARKHDVIPVVIEDLRERELPDAGWIVLQDAETGEIVEVDSSNPKVRAAYKEEQVRRRKERTALFKSAGVTPVEVLAGTPYVPALQAFFERRIRARAAD